MEDDQFTRIALTAVGVAFVSALLERRRRKRADRTAYLREIRSQQIYFFWRELGRLWADVRRKRAAYLALLRRLR